MNKKAILYSDLTEMEKIVACMNVELLAQKFVDDPGYQINEFDKNLIIGSITQQAQDLAKRVCGEEYFANLKALKERIDALYGKELIN